jgi:hypothetical protein
VVLKFWATWCGRAARSARAQTGRAKPGQAAGDGQPQHGREQGQFKRFRSEKMPCLGRENNPEGRSPRRGASAGSRPSMSSTRRALSVGRPRDGTRRGREQAAGRNDAEGATLTRRDARRSRPFAPKRGRGFNQQPALRGRPLRGLAFRSGPYSPGSYSCNGFSPRVS